MPIPFLPRKTTLALFQANVPDATRAEFAAILALWEHGPYTNEWREAEVRLNRLPVRERAELLREAWDAEESARQRRTYLFLGSRLMFVIVVGLVLVGLKVKTNGYLSLVTALVNGAGMFLQHVFTKCSKRQKTIGALLFTFPDPLLTPALLDTLGTALDELGGRSKAISLLSRLLPVYLAGDYPPLEKRPYNHLVRAIDGYTKQMKKGHPLTDEEQDFLIAALQAVPIGDAKQNKKTEKLLQPLTTLPLRNEQFTNVQQAAQAKCLLLTQTR